MEQNEMNQEMSYEETLKMVEKNILSGPSEELKSFAKAEHARPTVEVLKSLLDYVCILVDKGALTPIMTYYLHGAIIDAQAVILNEENQAKLK